MTDKQSFLSLPIISIELKKLKYNLITHCERQGFYPTREDFDNLLTVQKDLRDALYLAEKLMAQWING